MHSLVQVEKFNNSTEQILARMWNKWNSCAVCRYAEQYDLESNLAVSNKVEEIYISYNPAIPLLGTKILIKASFALVTT